MAVTPHDLLDTEELAALLGVRPSSLSTMRAQPLRHRSIDGLPEPLRLVSGRPVWERATVEAWVASRPPQRHTAPHRAEPTRRELVEPAVERDEPVGPIVEPVAPVADEEPWIPWPQAAVRPG